MGHPLDLIRTLATQNHSLLRQLAKDFPEDRLESPPFPGGNDARWVLGHLAISGDFTAQFLGLPSICPPDWSSRFGPGTTGQTHGGPGLAELLEMLERQHERIDAAARTVDPARLAKPHGVGFLDGSALKTAGDLVAFLLTNHAAMHIGQFSACRRAAGMPPLF